MDRYLETLKEMLVSFYEKCNALKEEANRLPDEDDKDLADRIAWELYYLKERLIGLVGKEMVRQELGIENVTRVPALSSLVSDIITFAEDYADGLTQEIIEDLLAEVGEATKREDGKDFPASDYAYVPDPKKPSTWKLRLTSTPGGKPDPQIVGAAAAALGKGFRGQKVQLPANARAAVIRKVRAAWRAANPGKKDSEMPDGIRVGSAAEAEYEPVEKRTLHIVAEAQPMDSDGNKFPFLVIAEGLSKNRKYYTAEALRKGAHLLNDAPIYLNHPEGVHEGRPQTRTFESKVGWWSDAHFAPAQNGHPAGIIATANIFAESAHPWLPRMLKEAIETGKTNHIGVSIYAEVEAQPVRDPEHGIIYKVINFERFKSADLVAEAAAGGRLVAAESFVEVEPEMGDEKQNTTTTLSLSAEQMQEIARLVRESAPPTAPAPEKDAKVIALEERFERLEKLSEDLNERKRKLDAYESAKQLRSALESAKLPPGVIDVAVAEADGSILTEEQIQAAVKRYTSVALESREAVLRSLPPSTRELVVPFQHGNQIHPLERVVASLDMFFGNEVAENLRDSPRIVSFRQFYGQLTGDWEVRGYYDKQQSVIGQYLGMTAAEALPTQAKFIGGGTITMPNLFGLSMNRRLLSVFRGQPRWWEPIAEQGPLSNFKQQDRIRTNHYGPLTNRPVGTEEYTELEWGESVETYTPSGWGNIVSVNRRAVINDDLNGIRRQPVLLARAANITLNEYVAALFTANGGAGVAMEDTNPAFHATRNNVGSLPLTYDNLLTTRRAMMNITDDAGNKLLNMPRYLLVPVELEAQAWVLQRSTGVPGSANNDPNILADNERGIRSVIVVPNFTDTNNWYAVVDKNESLMVPIEVGYINDQREPELFVQDAPTEGMVFTHDGLYFKVRFEFGADIIDPLAFYANIVP